MEITTKNYNESTPQ